MHKVNYNDFHQLNLIVKRQIQSEFRKIKERKEARNIQELNKNQFEAFTNVRHQDRNIKPQNSSNAALPTKPDKFKISLKSFLVKEKIINSKNELGSLLKDKPKKITAEMTQRATIDLVYEVNPVLGV